MSIVLETSPAGLEEREVALRLLYAALTEPERSEQIATILKEEAEGKLSLEGLLLARREGSAMGALLATLQPDGSGLVFPPSVVGGEWQDRVEESLMWTLCAWLDQKQVRLAQCLLEVEEDHCRRLFERYGFRCLAELIYLKRDDGPVPSRPGRRPQFVTYSPETHERFCRTLQRTYMDTEDCPELSKVRSAEEALAGHRLAGEFDPRFWCLYAEGGEDFGVLLLTRHPEAGLWELVYLGIVPEFRHHGWGQELMLGALETVENEGGAAMILAVDSINNAARKLYARLGFYECLQRAAHLRIHSSPEG
ncbi:MAG: GNAT family N-acetyltransferase [Planctomycetales bacterium]